MVEVHCAPESARSDGAQSLTPKHFSNLVAEVTRIAGAMGREGPSPEVNWSDR
jgi:3-deoxy-7-phosphoheptulonate synthase